MNSTSRYSTTGVSAIISMGTKRKGLPLLREGRTTGCSVHRTRASPLDSIAVSRFLSEVRSRLDFQLSE